MKWRVKESDCNRKSLELAEDADEVLSLHWKKLRKSNLALAICVSKNHLSHRDDSLATEEHMLCAAETNTFSTKLYCMMCICWCIGICAYAHCLELAYISHELAVVLVKHRLALVHRALENLHDLRWLYRNLLCVYSTCESID